MFFFLACFELFGGRLFAGVVHVHLVSYGRFRLNVQLLNERDGQTPAWWCSVNLKYLHDVWLLTWNNTRSHWETSRPPVSIIVSWWYQKMMPHFEQYSECRKSHQCLSAFYVLWCLGDSSCLVVFFLLPWNPRRLAVCDFSDAFIE